MALVPGNLATQLENGWMVADGGSHPQNALQSGQRFAGAVSTWFSAAQANGFPCATAKAREGQLAAQAAAAFQVMSAPGAGAQLALAIAAYYAGQSFGAGVATYPAAVAAGTATFSQVFADLNSPISARAQQMAGACQIMAVSTIVTFPLPLTPSPIM
jgi:hypothetical protein